MTNLQSMGLLAQELDYKTNPRMEENDLNIYEWHLFIKKHHEKHTIFWSSDKKPPSSFGHVGIPKKYICGPLIKFVTVPWVLVFIT